MHTFLPVTQQVLDPDDQFLHAERLAYIIIASQRESFYDVFGLCLGREEDNGHLFIQFADLIGNSEPIFVGQHHIQHADIRFHLFEQVQHFGAIAFHDHFKAPALQAFPDYFPEE